MHEVVSPRGPNAAARQSSKVYALWNEQLLLTVADAAKVLGLTPRGIRWLASQEHLPSERTLSGQYVFRWGDMKAAAIERAERRLAPSRVIREATGQGRLPFARAGRAPRLRPASWKLAKFTPRMLSVRVGRKGFDQKAQHVLPDREVKAGGSR